MMNRASNNQLASARYLKWLVTMLAFFSMSIAGQVQGQRPIPPGKQGYRISVDVDLNFDGSRTRLLRVKVETKPAKKLIADELLTLSIDSYPGGYRADQEPHCQAKQFVIQAGTSSVVVEMPLLTDYLADRTTCLRLERRKGDGKFNSNDFMRIPLDFRNSRPQLFLFIDSLNSTTLKPERILAMDCWEGMEPGDRDLMYDYLGYASTTSSSIGRPTSVAENPLFSTRTFLQVSVGNLINSTSFRAVNFKSIPSDPKAFDAVDRVLFRFSEFKKYCKDESRRENLEKWVASGGSLIIAGEGDFTHTSKIYDTLIGGRVPFPVEKQVWDGINHEIEYIETGYANQRQAVGNKRWRVDPNQLDPGKDHVILASSYVAGHIYSIRDLGVTKRVGTPIYSLLVSQAQTGFRPPRPRIDEYSGRSGASPIPGVGNPPIIFFIALVFTFLFAIGPILITYVRRMGGRTYRLFFAVPVISFLTCSFILGYSYITNIASQKARIKSVTVVHPFTGMAYNQSMMAYYCGSQPSYYEFAPDVTTISGVSSEDNFLLMSDLDELQQVSSDRISPRRLHYVLAESSRVVAQKLEIKEGANGEPLVLNQLGCRIKYAAFRHNGKFYSLEDVEDGARANGSPVNGEEIRNQMLVMGLTYLPKAGYFSKTVSGFFISGYADQVLSDLHNGDITDPKQGMLKVDHDFVAVVDNDPYATSVSEPFDYKMKSQIIYGKQ